MNSELCLKALEKVTNPNVLVNVVSRRVRQLNSADGAGSRPLVDGVETLGAADIALREIVEERLSYEMISEETDEPVAPKRRKRS